MLNNPCRIFAFLFCLICAVASSGLPAQNEDGALHVPTIAGSDDILDRVLMELALGDPDSVGIFEKNAYWALSFNLDGKFFALSLPSRNALASPSHEWPVLVSQIYRDSSGKPVARNFKAKILTKDQLRIQTTQRFSFWIEFKDESNSHLIPLLALKKGAVYSTTALKSELSKPDGTPSSITFFRPGFSAVSALRYFLGDFWPGYEKVISELEALDENELFYPEQREQLEEIAANMIVSHLLREDFASDLSRLEERMEDPGRRQRLAADLRHSLGLLGMLPLKPDDHSKCMNLISRLAQR